MKQHEKEQASERMIDELTAFARPGQFGTWRDKLFAGFDKQYGPGNWQFAWSMPNGEVWDFDKVFWNVYVGGYTDHFAAHPDEAEYLAANFAYAYDLTEISPEQAIDPYALIGVPGLPNQFHHVALNYAIIACTNGWRGEKPIAVRGPGTAGERWNPGHIQAREEYCSYGWPDDSVWWEPFSIEAVYQNNKTLYVRPAAAETRAPDDQLLQ